MSYTILGSSGFVGGHLVKELESQGEEIFATSRNNNSNSLPDSIFNRKHKHLVYCIGLTADFRTRPFDTVEAHICLLREILTNCDFETITYLSSTRVYLGGNSTHEDTLLSVKPADLNYLYNLSKLMGESLCLHSGKKARVVRLSNVFGSGMLSQNFLSTLFHEATRSEHVHFQTSRSSAKDYISITDVVRILPEIAKFGRHDIYNIANGRNITNLEISNKFNQMGIPTDFSDDPSEYTFLPINIERMIEEFGPPQHQLLDEFENIFGTFKSEYRNNNED